MSLYIYFLTPRVSLPLRLSSMFHRITNSFLEGLDSDILITSKAFFLLRENVKFVPLFRILFGYSFLYLVEYFTYRPTVSEYPHVKLFCKFLTIPVVCFSLVSYRHYLFL
jgi:hypothetical protein